MAGEGPLTFVLGQELRDGPISEARNATPAYVRTRRVCQNRSAFDDCFFGYNSRETEILPQWWRISLDYFCEPPFPRYCSAHYSGRIPALAEIGNTQSL